MEKKSEFGWRLVAVLAILLCLYPAQAYMIVADDDVREWGKQNWEEKSADYTAKGYIPISMKNDFARIYPEGITRAEEQFHEPAWSGESLPAVLDQAA